MSSAVRSQNLFELLGEDDNGSGAIPTPKPAPKVAAPAAPKAAAPAPAKKEAAAPRKQQNNRDRAPRQPRGEEPGSSVGEVFDKRRREPTSTRGGRGGAKRVPAGAASHGGFDKKSGGHVDSQKKIENGSGHLTGEAELADETAGAADADADAKAAAASGVATPAEGEVAEKKEDAPKRRSHEEEEEEDNTQSYAEYLASKAAAAIEGVTQLSKRVVSEWTGEGEVVKKDAEDAFFAAKEKTQKALKARKEKNTIEIDGKFATEEKPASAARGGRGGFEGRRGGERREGGAPRGGRGGARGAFRGNTRGAAPVARKEKTPAVNLADETAFPSLA